MLYCHIDCLVFFYFGFGPNPEVLRVQTQKLLQTGLGNQTQVSLGLAMRKSNALLLCNHSSPKIVIFFRTLLVFPAQSRICCFHTLVTVDKSFRNILGFFQTDLIDQAVAIYTKYYLKLTPLSLFLLFLPKQLHDNSPPYPHSLFMNFLIKVFMWVPNQYFIPTVTGLFMQENILNFRDLVKLFSQDVKALVLEINKLFQIPSTVAKTPSELPNTPGWIIFYVMN